MGRDTQDTAEVLGASKEGFPEQPWNLPAQMGQEFPLRALDLLTCLCPAWPALRIPEDHRVLPGMSLDSLAPQPGQPSPWSKAQMCPFSLTLK